MYKFYTIPDLDILDKIIGKNPTIKFSSAFNLNDPFELKFNLSIDPYAEGHLEAYLKMKPEKTKEDFKDWQEQVADNDGYRWYEEQTQRAFLSQKITLCSFTMSNKNNLMWSHYTDNHKGICVEYSDNIVQEFLNLENFLLHGNVIYSDSPPNIDMLEDVKSQIEKMTLNKQSEWKYEKEHRVIFLSDNETDYIKISPKAIKAVYIGSRACDTIISKTIALCDQNNYECYKGITVGETYKVKFERHKEGTIYMRTFWS